MKRRLFTILAALSLLLFVAVVVIWVRSYWIEDHLTPSADFLITSQTGRSTLCHFPNVQVEVPVQRDAAMRRVLHASAWRDLWAEHAVRRRRFGGFDYARIHIGGGERYTLLAIPYWAMAIGMGIPPALWLLRAYRSRAVQLAGLCPSCGYDLRATPGRCPECGLVPAAPPPPP